MKVRNFLDCLREHSPYSIGCEFVLLRALLQVAFGAGKNLGHCFALLRRVWKMQLGNFFF